MAISEVELKIEIGSTAYDDLERDELNFICQNSDSVAFGGLKAFEILMKKYKPSYKMGRMFCNDGDKYAAYRDIFNSYARQFSAGKLESLDSSDVVEFV